MNYNIIPKTATIVKNIKVAETDFEKFQNLLILSYFDNKINIKYY